MQIRIFQTLPLFALTAAMAFGQARPAFEVASIKPSAPLDMAKLAADMKAGKMPKMGAHVEMGHAEYTYVALRDLISLAYGVKPYQVSGPAWLAQTRFDISAKMPEGSKREDAPKMMQALLEDRFKLKTHLSKAEHPALVLVVGKGGPKLKESTETPKAIDPNSPLRENEIETETPDGPVRVMVGQQGSAKVDMGMKGKVSYGMNPANQSFHMDGSMITMQGFAEMLTQFSNMFSGGNTSNVKQVVDQTDLKGHYEITMEFAIADMIQMARSAGMDIPAGAPGGGGAPADSASDPNGGASTILKAVQDQGLRLESRKAMVEQLIVDSAEKTPTEN